MGDYISEFDRAQVELAEKCAAEMTLLMPVELRSGENEGVFAFFSAEVEKNSILAMQGWAHWLATKLIRSKNFEKQKMPICDAASVLLLSKERNFSYIYIGLLMSFLTRPGTKLPLVGEVADDGQLIPDKEALARYESSFDFGK